MNPADPKILIKGVRKQDRRLLSKTITLIESSRPDHQQLARHIVDELLPHTGKAIRLGITGVPGVGKSTFIESLGTLLVEGDHRVAVLAVDPSSSKSGGSVMADKTRMEKLAVEKKCVYTSVAVRGYPGRRGPQNTRNHARLRSRRF